MRALIEGRLKKRVRIYVNGRQVEDSHHLATKEDLSEYLERRAKELNAKWVNR